MRRGSTRSGSRSPQFIEIKVEIWIEVMVEGCES
jgi:hypothetical protein